jgi:hypothetical protein
VALASLVHGLTQYSRQDSPGGADPAAASATPPRWVMSQPGGTASSAGYERMLGAGVTLVVGYVTDLDPGAGRATVSGPDGVRELSFDRVVMATGSIAEPVPVPGGEHAHAVGDLASAHRLRPAFAALREGAEVAVVGGGFTGLETVGVGREPPGRAGAAGDGGRSRRMVRSAGRRARARHARPAGRGGSRRDTGAGCGTGPAAVGQRRRGAGRADCLVRRVRRAAAGSCGRARRRPPGRGPHRHRAAIGLPPGRAGSGRRRARSRTGRRPLQHVVPVRVPIRRARRRPAACRSARVRSRRRPHRWPGQHRPRPRLRGTHCQPGAPPRRAAADRLPDPGQRG